MILLLEEDNDELHGEPFDFGKRSKRFAGG
jgi:hypothetical protein